MIFWEIMKIIYSKRIVNNCALSLMGYGSPSKATINPASAGFFVFVADGGNRVAYFNQEPWSLFWRNHFALRDAGVSAG